jgi:arylsulfatase A-like enzyme
VSIRRGAARAVAVAACALLAAAACGRDEERPPRGVVLVVVDTLRADHLGLYGYGRETSPALDRAAREGRVFRRALASSSWTLPSFGSILTGTRPSIHGAGGRIAPPPGSDPSLKWARPLREDLPSLPALLAERGWKTAAFLNNSWLLPHLGVARGFETFDAAPATQLRNRSAQATVDAAFRWLDSIGEEQPFLAVVHFFEPHVGYRPDPGVRGRFAAGIPTRLRYESISLSAMRRRLPRLTDADRSFVTAAYDEEVLTADLAVERLFGGLRERGLWDESLVVLTADHGEELFDHGGFEHGHTMYQELLHVPFVVWGPGVAAGSDDAPVSLEDVAPTVLAAAGMEVPAQVTGRSLLRGLRGAEPPGRRTLVAQGALHGPDRRAILRWPMKLVATAGAPPQLFDLRGDPGERRDLAAGSPALAAALLAELDRLSASGAGGGGEAVELPPEAVEELRSLGYVQ